MGDCAVCLDAIEIERAPACLRYFMPCACRILLCDACVTKVAQGGRCLWCRKREPNISVPPNFDASEAANLLALSSNTITTLRENNNEVRWQNMLMRVELFHFRRFQWYKGWGFILGAMGGAVVGITCGVVTSGFVACGILSVFRFMTR